MLKFRRCVLLVVAAVWCAMATSCLYRMPEEDEVRTVPNTNNPDVTLQKSEEWMPSVSY